METAQGLALGQDLVALIVSCVQAKKTSGLPSAISHFGHHDGNSRTTYGGDMYNIHIGSSPNPQGKPDDPETHYHVPHNVCSHFTGREDELEKITDAFSSPHPGHGARRFVVFGIGGTGKTQLCLKFAEANRDSYWGVFFVDASTELDADNSFASIALTAGRKPSKEEGFDWLANVSKKWLLIIDNADSPDFDVQKYCPSSTMGHILVTTINKRCKQVATVGYHELERMPSEDAITLLLKVAEMPTEDPEYRSQARPLVEDLDCLALALYMAGAAIYEGQYRLDRYREIYAEMFKHNENSIYTTWEVSRQAVESMGTDQSAQACEILDIASLFHFQGIPEALFTGSPPRIQKSETFFKHLGSLWVKALSWGSHQLFMMKNPETLSGLQRYLGDLRDFHPVMGQQRDISSVHSALGILFRFSLISFDKSSDSFSMHRLVHQWSRHRLSAQNRRWSRWAAAAGLVSAIPAQEHRNNDACNERRRLFPHVSFFLSPDSLPEESQRLPEGSLRKCLDSHQSRVAAKLALVFVESCQYLDAELLYREALAGLEKALSERHLDTLAVVDNLGVVLERQNKYDEATEMNIRAFEGRKRWLGEDHALTLESQSNLAVTLNSRGEHGNAEAVHRLVLLKRETTLTPESPYTMDSVNNLAISLNGQGKYEKAAELYTRALAWREDHFGKYHLETIQSLNDLAAALHNDGLPGPAREKYSETLRRRLYVLGRSHPETLLNMSDLAVMNLEKGDFVEAEKLSREAYDLIEAHTGVARSYAPIIISTHARVKSKQRDYQEAEQLCWKALEAFENERHPPTHPDLLHHLSLLATVLRRQKKYDEAKDIYHKVLTGHQQRPDQPNIDTMVCLTNLAVVLENQEKWEGAETAHRKALDGLTHLLPKNHPLTLDCLENCAKLLARRKEYSEAESMYCMAVEGRRDRHSRGHGDPGKEIRNIAGLAQLLHQQGRHGKAWALYQASSSRYEAAGIADRYYQRCTKRFTALKDEIGSTEAPLLSETESVWVERILALSDEEVTMAEAEAGRKRRRTASPASEPEEPAEKRPRHTAELTSGESDARCRYPIPI